MVSSRAAVDAMPAHGGTVLVGGEALTGVGAAKRLDSSLGDVCRIAERVGGSYGGVRMRGAHGDGERNSLLRGILVRAKFIRAMRWSSTSVVKTDSSAMI